MELAEIGLIGLGTMGAALALNIAEKGFRIAVFNRTTERTREFSRTAGALADRIVASETLEALVDALRPPRAIILMVPAGEAVDEHIARLRPLLAPSDMIIDAGNANFHDTNRRAEQAAEDGVPYLGIGVSGGEDGARHGPSIMGGGPRAAWDRVAPVLEAIAARYDGTPCATWMGEAGAGHFVKTVHNGIEYADMQMIAETYGVMRDGLGMEAHEIGEVFGRWNTGPLESYLVEISGRIAGTEDPHTGRPLLDVILDKAGQKGTGRWTVIEAQHLAAPVTAIDAAVAARNISARIEERREGEARFGAAPTALPEGRLGEADLESALIAGKILCYAQGFAMIGEASERFGWSLPLPDIARVWRAGCIIRSAMLDDMASALTRGTGTLIFDDVFAGMLRAHGSALRRVVAESVQAGLPMPALSAALSYFDMIRTSRSTANMIQGQRDYFGLHGFERLDGKDIRHGPWAG